MKPQSIKSVEITLDSKTIGNIWQLGVCLQNIEKLYTTACQQLEISGNSLLLTKLDLSKNILTVNGLEIPLKLTKEVVEKEPSLFQESKLEQYENKATDNKSVESLFEHVTKGIEKIDDSNLSQHVSNSLSYWLARNQMS